MKDKLTPFRDRLEEALKTRNMLPYELSKKTGISQSTISQYRSGYSKPKDEKLNIIANALEVHPAWLKGYPVPMDLNSDGDWTLIETFKQSNPAYAMPRFKLLRSEEKVLEAYRNASKDVQKAVRLMLGLRG